MLGRSLSCFVFGAVLAGPPPGHALAAVEDEPSAAAEEPVISRRRNAGGDEQMLYFLIGSAEEGEAPGGGYRLLVVLPGGDGSAEFEGFVKRIWQNALSDRYLVAQLVAPKWQEDQQIVWPTAGSPVARMKFTTEEFVAEVVDEVRGEFAVDEDFVFVLGWSSGGPPAYAVTLDARSPVTGAFVAMSVFKRENLPSLKYARRQAYFLLHSPEDWIKIDQHAEIAVKALEKAGAEVVLETYPGGHGWHGPVYSNLRKGIEWLEVHHGAARR